MPARMPHPIALLPQAVKPIQEVYAAALVGGVPPSTLALAHMRASQINGCSFCVASGFSNGRQAGESDERLLAVSAWRDTEVFNEAERAALALTECVTRLADCSDPVPDAIWNEAARHYDAKGLA
ncbi:MAG: carboxymuconolactone decarboxylase family protein, partial [Terriglobales bacterium]